MALSDFQIFNDYGYRAFAVTLQQNIALFNQATRGAITLDTMAVAGDQHQKAAFENLASLVGNRNPASTAAASEHALKELLRIDVKVGWGTPNITYTNTSFDWTNRDPAEAGRLFGEDVAQGAMQYMLNTLLYSAVSAISASDVNFDGTAGIASIESLIEGAGKFGDRQGDIVAWVMHSKSQTDIWKGAVQNSNDLFDFANIRVVSDGHGRPLIMTDSDALHFDNAGTENYIQLGLVQGALSAQDQGDMRSYNVTDLDQENARQLLKAEGSFMVGLKGYTFDSAITKPNDTQLAAPGSWSRVTDLGLKDTAGVKVTTL